MTGWNTAPAPQRPMTIDTATARHKIREQTNNGARVVTNCGLEIWRAPNLRHQQKNPDNCRNCYP